LITSAIGIHKPKFVPIGRKGTSEQMREMYNTKFYLFFPDSPTGVTRLWILTHNG